MIGRWVVIAGIAFYRNCLKPFWYRECIFRESCSAYVLRKGKAGGLPSALRAFAERCQTCRPDFSVVCQDGAPYALTHGGALLPSAELTASVRRELRQALAAASAIRRMSPAEASSHDR